MTEEIAHPPFDVTGVFILDTERVEHHVAEEAVVPRSSPLPVYRRHEKLSDLVPPTRCPAQYPEDLSGVLEMAYSS